MDQSEEVVKLLKEIRDLHRDHLAEYKRVSQVLLELNQGAVKANQKEYQRSIEASRSFTWAFWIFIAISSGANLWMMVRFSATSR